MTDETPTQIPSSGFTPDHPRTALGPDPSKPTEPKTPKVDHLSTIEELVRGLHNVSPSGAETVRDKILQCIADIRDPKAYDARMAAEKKAHDDALAAGKKIREADRAAVAKASKVA
jgi:hypothetical protein